MRSGSKKKKAVFQIPRLSRALRNLKKRSYSSAGEYYEGLRKAVSAFGTAALKLARSEANFIGAITSPLLHMRRTLEVNPEDDATKDFEKIQAAIDNANPGDRILLKCGTFRSGGVLWVWKDLAIEGEPGAVIEGTTHHHGKVVADPFNGGFILLGNPNVQIRNLRFRNLYFAVASHEMHGLDNILFENNVCEDVYHSVYINGDGSELVGRCNRILVTSLNAKSPRCRFNFYDEAHVFGFYCDGNSRAVLEDNKLEIRELSADQPFHAVGAFFSRGKAVLRKNLFKGWHAPIVMHHSAAHIHDNEIHGLCNDSRFTPIGISLRACDHATVTSNRIESRNLGSGGIGIAAFGGEKGKILGNAVSISDAENGIMLHKSDHFVVGLNKLSAPLALFGDQSRDVTGNLVFDNTIDHRVELKMNYAAGNTVIGPKARMSDDKDNVLLGYGSRYEEASPVKLEQENYERHQRVFDHMHKKVWPDAPGKYLSDDYGKKEM